MQKECEKGQLRAEQIRLLTDDEAAGLTGIGPKRLRDFACGGEIRSCWLHEGGFGEGDLEKLIEELPRVCLWVLGMDRLEGGNDERRC